MLKEGYWYGLPLVLISGGLAGLGLYWPAVVFLLAAAFICNFFRDPERIVPPDPKAMVSPADGRVVEVRLESYEDRPVRRVSIFMSPLNVHVNRSPITGTIGEVSYHAGRFRIASQAVASVENEQNIFTISGELGSVVVKQIAGALARRIVFWKRSGDAIQRGERVGLIKFGSRVDVLLEPSVELRVKVGESVRAGSSIIGYVNGNRSQPGA